MPRRACKRRCSAAAAAAARHRQRRRRRQQRPSTPADAGYWTIGVGRGGEPLLVAAAE